MYINVISHLGNAVKRQLPENGDSLFPLHDNAPAHRLDLVKDFVRKNNVETLEHPPYSHHLATSDFYVFPWTKW